MYFPDNESHCAAHPSVADSFMKELLLIDANSLIHRAYHALPKTFTSPRGNPTNALFGLSRIILKIIRENPAEYAAACFDRPEPTFRKQEFKEYKATRPEAPDDLISQIIGARDLFGAFGVPFFEAVGFEADDIIATLAEQFCDESDLRVVILTGDRDTLQLVRGEKVIVRAPKKGVSETIIYDESAVREKYGLLPNQLIDYKALMGDQSDNIKGVSGIGPKTAAELLERYGTLENLYASLGKDEVLSKKLEGTEAVAFTAKRLVTLIKNVPLGVDALDTLRWNVDEEKLQNYFREMGFGSLLKAAEGETRKPRVSRRQESQKRETGQGTMW